MEIKIAGQIFEKYPEVEIGVVVAKNVDNGNYDEEIQKLMREVEKETRGKFDIDDILEVPAVAKWREIYKSFGAKPSKFRNSVEALMRRVLRGDEIYKINPLVDIYNMISVKYVMTVGGEDVDAIEGDLVLDFAKGDEEFVALGASESESPWEGEVVYKDDKGVVCRCWNYREAERTKLSEGTKEAVIVVENNLPERSGEFREALDELKGLLERYCGAECEVKILNKENVSGVINGN
jgi:DNA/RNA-binding domain of Phe-tRNA-synthetase-like protein